MSCLFRLIGETWSIKSVTRSLPEKVIEHKIVTRRGNLLEYILIFFGFNSNKLCGISFKRLSINILDKHKIFIYINVTVN